MTGQDPLRASRPAAYLEGIDPAAPMSAFAARHDIPGLPARSPSSPIVRSTARRRRRSPNGLSPVVPLADGTCSLARSITSRSQEDTTTAPNYSVLDTSKVTVPRLLSRTPPGELERIRAAEPEAAPDPADGGSDPRPPRPRRSAPGSHELESRSRTGCSERRRAPAEPLGDARVDPAGRAIAKIPLDVIEGKLPARHLRPAGRLTRPPTAA